MRRGRWAGARLAGSPDVGGHWGVPWCETCDRFYNPNTLRPDGTCPTCGRVVADPGRLAVEADAEERPDEAHSGAPWHFKLLVAATAVYLSYRLFQGIVWVGHHL